MDFLRETETSLFSFAVLEKEVDFTPVQSDVWHTKTEGGTRMGHSTASGRSAGSRDSLVAESRRVEAAVQSSIERAFGAAATPPAPRYEMPVDFQPAVPNIVRNMEPGERLSVTNDTSSLDVVRISDSEYNVTRQWQEPAPNGGYYSLRDTTVMNRGQATRAIRRETGERSTVRLGRETLLRYRRNRG